MTFRELKQHFGLGDYQVRLPQAMLRHVHLSGVACALTQLLTLRPPARGLGRWRWWPMPWPRRQTPVSVCETQLPLRQACQGEGTSRHLASRKAPREKPRAAPRAHEPTRSPL
jgi:hypothetical protein